MKKNNLMFYLALGIVFALFNIITFVIPTEKTSTIWTGYVFSVMAFALQVIFWTISVGKNNTLKNKFLGISIIYVGIAYLIIQLIAFMVFMFFPMAPVWVAVVVYTIIFAITALCVIAGKTGENEINRVEEKINQKRTFIQFLQVEIEMIAEREKEVEIKAGLKNLAEKVRYSDPMSHEMLGELEALIFSNVEEMKTAIDKKSYINQIDILLIERNKKCKILK